MPVAVLTAIVVPGMLMPEGQWALRPDNAYLLAGLLANQGVLGRHRVAHVVNAGTQYGVARMVCTLAELRGADARVFTEEPQALSWLAGAAEIQQE